MDLEDWQRIHNRLDRAHINAMNTHYGRRDLWTMHRAVYEKLREADREWVECRRLGRATPRFDSLITEAEEAVKNFEAYILIAKLKQKDRE